VVAIARAWEVCSDPHRFRANFPAAWQATGPVRAATGLAWAAATDRAWEETVRRRCRATLATVQEAARTVRSPFRATSPTARMAAAIARGSVAIAQVLAATDR
jgi:hypothetical protein